MSHFTVLVVTDKKPTDEVLSTALLPFHEYECTGIKEYLQFVPVDQAELVAEHQKFGKGEDLATYIKQDYGDYYYQNEAGEWGRMTNPNKKWDWWSVGGRWSGMLIDADGRVVNSCQKKDLDLEAMSQARRERRKQCWAAYQSDLMTRGGKDESVRFWNGVTPGVDYDTFIATDPGFSTFALLKDGQWHEKGQMLWFAIVADEKADWPTQYQQLFADIPDDAWLTVVDCHI